MNQKVDIKRLKQKLKLSDYEQIFKALDIPVYSQGEKYWKLYTGCHHKNPYNGSPKLLFYPETGLCQCLTQCNCTTDIISLVQRRLSVLKRNCSFKDAIDFIGESTDIDLKSVQRIHEKKCQYDWEDDLGKFIRFRSTGSTGQIYDKNILNGLENRLPQEWIDEGISIDSMNKYRIGYYPRLNQTTIPCFNKEGELIGIRVRNWQPDRIEDAKYMPLITLNNSCYKFNTNDNFYGINYNWGNIENTQTVILVEGEKSVLKADTWFGDESNVLALYGSNLGLKRRNQLVKMGVKHVILALDSDYHIADENEDNKYTKFIDKLLNIGAFFKNYCTVEVVFNNIGLDAYKCSPFDFDYKTYKQLYDNRLPIDMYINDISKMKKGGF